MHTMADGLTPESRTDPAGGRSAAEKTLARIWAEVLRLPDVAVDANFFEIGGDSIKVMEVIMRAGEALGVDIPLMAFFEDPTVAHLAAVADELKGSSSASEMAIAQIWAEVLRLPDVAVDANFFEIGGDSIKVMEVIMRIGEVMGVDVPLMAFFEDPTVAHLATVADELKGGDTDGLIKRVPGRREFPLSHSQQVFWLLAQQNRGTGLYITARIFRVQGKLDSGILERSLNELRRRHEILQVRFVLGNDGPRQIVDPRDPLHLELSDLRAVDSESREQAAQEQALATVREPFDLEAGPVLRARLVRLTEEDSLLCVAIHHAVSDGFTGSIFLDELSAIYDAFAAGQPNPLPELELHFTDYAAWEREWMSGSRLDRELGYWRSVLTGAPGSIDLPTDGTPASELDRRGRLKTINYPAELLQRLQSLAQSNGTTLFAVLTAAFRILLYRWSGQTDFMIGTIASNRSWSLTERMIGCFVNPLALRNPVVEGESAASLLGREKSAVMDAFAHQDCPFPAIVEAINPERTGSDNPFFNVALLLQSFPAIAVRGRCFQAQDISFDAQIALLDLRFIATETAAGLEVNCEYNTSLFEDGTIDNLLAAYRQVMSQIVSAPETAVAEIEIPDALAQQAEAHRRAHYRQKIAIAANFTAEPIQDPLAFWMEQLHIPSRIEFAPFDQVFQQLLDPASLLAGNADGLNMVLIQWREGHPPGEQARELAKALKTRAARGGAPILVCVCPPTVTDEELVLNAALAGQTGIHVVHPHEILDLYPVANYRDAYADAVGAIPYTPEFFIALASMAARRIFALRSTPFKVIALDCDNTLWKGVCGEDGALGVEVDVQRRALQEFMLAQREAGMLLCLCSKNVEADVAAVFASNPGMLLRPEHFVASRINWQSKSENLQDLASDLKLGVESFIFVDDNPLECAEVRANCPGTLVLQLPAEDASIPHVLRHLWAFDHWNLTQEDRKRSELYQQEQEREQARSGSGDLAGFIRSLDLKIDIRPMQPDDVARVSQLTQRTNQFNCTTIRRSEGDIASALEGGQECLVVKVRDRFGDYGLVGIAIFAAEGGALTVDTLLMSCRALGRKVEHQILSRLGAIAVERELARVDVRFTPSEKNRPAFDFLESVGARFVSTSHGSSLYTFPATYASRVHELESAELAQPEEPAAGGTIPSLAAQTDLERIATELDNVGAVARAIRARAVKAGVETSPVKARNATEEILSGIWAGLLHTPAPGVHDDFFRLGGNSLLAVQVLSRVRQTLGVELPLRAMFDEPTLGGLARRIDAARRARTGVVTPPLVRASRVGPVPASFAQQRLWFIDQYEPQNPIYNIPQMTRMRGPLHVEALQQSLTEIVRRHEVLRTTFEAVDGQPIQVIGAATGVRLPLTDLSQVPEPLRASEIQRVALEEAARPFNLAHGPVLRARLLRSAPDDHILLIVLHHIAGDRWSAGILAEEMEALYKAYATGDSSPLPEPPVQYADFSVWQRGWLQGQQLDNQAAYWRRQLAGAPAVLELPTDRPRPALLSHKGATQTALLPMDLVDKLNALSQSEGVTLFMTLLAAFQTLLGRYSGQDDIVVGSPIAGRNNTEIEQLIGFFVNTLALRADLSGDPAFRDLMLRVKETTLNAYSHQDIPFERLVEELQPERSLSYQPIFQVVFALQNAPQRSLELAGLSLERLPLHQGTSAFDMSWFATQVANGLQIRAEYNTDLFDSATVGRAIGHLRNLLEAVVAHPEHRLSELKLLDQEELRRVLVDVNATETEYAKDRCAHELFEEWAERAPDHVAVSNEASSLTYRQLNTRANQLAHHLRERGVGVDSRVGIFLERSIDFVVAILGVLKAGGAYLPIDPAYPPERVAFMLEDAQCLAVLTSSGLAGSLPPDACGQIRVDADWTPIGAHPVSNPVQIAKAGDLAYMIYTSGSTGKPKGVQIEHGSLLNLIAWHRHTYSVREADRATQVAGVAFDASVWEIWPYLTAGARLCIPDQETVLSPESLLRWLAHEGVTLSFLPTPLAESALDALRRIRVDGLKLRALLTGGDKLSRRPDPALSFEVVNHYGPTENTVVATALPVATEGDSAPPIGKPIWNTRVYVLDGHRNPAPYGIPGELYIGGDGLARGYWNRTELTAARFVPDPFSSKPGARLYRTGDRVRFLPDGSLAFLGRLDDQVKVRGFRIELGEIEAALRQHPAVIDCIVIAREDVSGNKRLIGYVVVGTAAAPSVAELRSLLATSLPEYMVPHVFVMLDALPITPNGKVNRNALPVPDDLVEQVEYVAPRTATERILAAIWSDVLHIEQIGVTHNFFALGGHSLLATQIVSRVRQSMDVELPLRSIFEAPTIEGLAKRIAGTEHSAQLTVIPRVPREQSLPLSFAQERLWFLDQLEPGNPQYNGPLPMRLKGLLNPAAMQGAINAIIQRHEVLRTTFRMDNDRPVQEIASELTIELPVIDISAVPAQDREQEARRLAVEEARRPFNLKIGPVVRASLLRLDEEDHILLLDIHHIATDGWSIWPFIQELGALYEACRANLPSPLPDLPIQYADFAVWQRQWIESDLIAGQLAYWKNQLAGAPERINLPTDRPRPAVQSYRGATETVFFPTALLNQLHVLGQREDVTLYMTLLAAFQTLLQRYTGQESIVVGSPIANRTRAEIEDLIGFFVNMLVMHSDLSGNPTFRELLQRVRGVALGAFANQDLPFEKLVEAIAPGRDLSSNPLVQVLFVMQNTRRSVLRIAGVEFAGMPIHNETTKFDIGIFLLETPDGLSCMAEYATDLFDASTIRRMLGHFGTLLEAIVKNPDRHIGELPLLSSKERQVLEAASSGAQVAYPRGRSLHELFEEQVERTPDHVALTFEDQSLTYRELNARANQLASFLRRLGVGPESLVGLYTERSLGIVVGLMGILKAGGAYVPIDPAYPKDRIGFMLQDSQVSVLLTQESLLASICDPQARVVCLDSEWKTIAQESPDNLSVGVKPDNLAYVIYTSGSTGKPKGCLVTHYNVVRLMQATEPWFHFDDIDVWTLFHSHAFDFSVWEIWGALLYGGRLVVVPYWISRSPERFHQLLREQSVTVLNQTPSAFRQLIQADQAAKDAELKLRVVIFGGEALELESLRPWFEKHGDQRPQLVNMYGITETTVHVTYRPLSLDDLQQASGSVIGGPIPDLTLYILDSQLQPTPIGVPGEICVGGAGVARGYLNRPELTQQRFIENPCSPQSGDRLYRSGDLARRLANGDIEYLGRIDQQVKIRGFRIELGEIESTLATHPGVRESVVIAREDEPGDKRLVAYLVPDSEYKGADQQDNTDSLSAERVAQWVATFDEAYRQGGDIADSTFNITGWDSSYTFEQIPAAEMKVWVETTVDRILALKPERLWEIGCGTGLLLFNVAPHCERYFGTDVSSTALSYLEQQLKRPELNLPQVALERRPAHQFEDTRQRFDVVVVNSVAQYFPDFDYFLEVLTGAVEAAGPNGSVFIGDLRSLPLLETFQTSVQMYRASDTTTVAELQQLIAHNIEQEGELLIDPEFFHAVRQRLPGIKRVEIQQKRGRVHNELTRFRYDVTLHLGATAAEKVDCASVNWQQQAFTLDLLRETLRATQPEMLAVTGVPNARLQYDSVARGVLMRMDGPETIGEVREIVDRKIHEEQAMDPEDFWMLEAEAPYRVEIRSSRGQADDCFDVILRRVDANGHSQFAELRYPGEQLGFQPLRKYANNPLRQRVASQLIPQLRLWLGAKLPDYMIPQVFVVLDAMPLSTNGKVDKKALPVPDQSGLASTRSYVAPQTSTQEIVASIMAEVLRIERVGLTDNFFEMGGHSLSATQVVARARAMFGVELSVRVLFEAPTVAELAQSIERLQRGKYHLETPPMVRADRKGALPLSSAQQRLWFQYEMDPESPLYNIPWATRLTGLLDAKALEVALLGIVRRHEILRTTYGMEMDLPVQRVLPKADIQLESRDLTALPAPEREREARRMVQQESARPFNLTSDVLFRPMLLKLGERDHVLFVNMHHIACDGWSLGVMASDLAALYESALAGDDEPGDRPSPLPELPIQYADFAVWQRSWLKGEILERQLTYWKQRLEGAPPVLALPTDRPRSGMQSVRGATERVPLAKSLTERINLLSRQQGVSSFMTMLAAFQCLILYYTKQPDIVLGTDLAGRTAVETEALIGFFVNLIVLRTDLSHNPAFSQLLGRVREMTLGAYAHQDLPFDTLVRELQPERSISHNPLVQVLFVHMNTPRSSRTLSGIELNGFQFELPSKFDLAVFCGENEQGVSGSWNYNPDLFDRRTIVRMAEQFQSVLEQVTGNPDLRLSDIQQTLAGNEQQQQMEEHSALQEKSLAKLKGIKRRPAGAPVETP